MSSPITDDARISFPDTHDCYADTCDLVTMGHCAGVVMAANCSQLIAHLQTKLIADCAERTGSSRGKSTPPGPPPGPATDEATNSENDRKMRREVVIRIISSPPLSGPMSISL